MRIGVDGRSLSGHAPRGVARVTFELLTAMATRFPQDDWRVLVPRGSDDIPPGVSMRRTRVGGRILFGSAALIGRPRLDALLGGVDVVWLPAPVPVAISASVPFVLTLHDLSWVERPADFGPYERAWHLLARARTLARRAARVAAVSEQTRRTAIERWGLDPKRIIVVTPPLSERVRPGPRNERGEPTRPGREPDADPHFLWVGAVEPRKAPGVLEEAWRIAHRRGLVARLVVVGDGPMTVSGPGVERRGRVSDGELAALYDDAIALVLPSWLEGLGLPPLEAALHGTPSICSDLPALRESLGAEGAEWVAPGDSVALAEALIRLAGDRRRREQIAAAAERAATARADAARPAASMRALLAEVAE